MEIIVIVQSPAFSLNGFRFISRKKPYIRIYDTRFNSLAESHRNNENILIIFV